MNGRFGLDQPLLEMVVQLVPQIDSELGQTDDRSGDTADHDDLARRHHEPPSLDGIHGKESFSEALNMTSATMPSAASA